jgi:hypothetical protein
VAALDDRDLVLPRFLTVVLALQLPWLLTLPLA